MHAFAKPSVQQREARIAIAAPVMHPHHDPVQSTSAPPSNSRIRLLRLPRRTCVHVNSACTFKLSTACASITAWCSHLTGESLQFRRQPPGARPPGRPYSPTAPGSRLRFLPCPTSTTAFSSCASRSRRQQHTSGRIISVSTAKPSTGALFTHTRIDWINLRFLLDNSYPAADNQDNGRHPR